MDPRSGDVYALRESLLEETEVGDEIDIARLREQVSALEHQALNVTADELEAAQRERLIAVSEQAARKLKLGAREQDRRRRRRH